MSFNGGGMENRMARHLDSKDSFETNPVVRTAYEKTQRLFKRDAIDPKGFADLYDPKAIQRDLAYVEKLKTTVFETGSGKIAADILEGVVYEQIELANWFGDHAHTIKTSEYDDIANGVDLMVEFDEPEASKSHLALGIDATYGVQGIAKKLDRIRRDIDQGELTRVKYFESSDGSFKGQLSQVPRIILGVERDTVLSLARLWTEGKNKELGAHPIQELLLRQARSQLVTFARYAKTRNRSGIEKSYMNAYQILKAASSEREQSVSAEAIEALSKDRVHQEVLLGLGDFR